MQQQIPTFTQNAPDHDVLVVADEGDLFGEYLPYRTWDARPVAGTAGLVADELASGASSYGAARSSRTASSGWPIAPCARSTTTPGSRCASVGEAATRTKSREVGELVATTSEVGRSSSSPPSRAQELTFRAWNGQLRQPILLTTPQAAGHGLAAAGLPASVHASSTRSASTSRKPNARPTRNEPCIRNEMGSRRTCQSDIPNAAPRSLGGRSLAPCCRRRRRSAYTVFVTNEKDNTVTRHRQREARGDQDLQGRPAPARHHPVEGRQVADRLHQRRQHHPGLRHQDLRAGEDPAVRARPGAVHPASVRQPALRRQRGRQPRHRRRHRAAARCWPTSRSASSPRAWA